MNTRSPLDASLSPKASPLVPQVKTASLGSYLAGGALHSPLLAAGVGATTMGLLNRYAPQAVHAATSAAPRTALLAPAATLGLGGMFGTYGGRFLANKPGILGAVGAGTAAGIANQALNFHPAYTGLAAATGGLLANAATRGAVARSFGPGGLSRRALGASGSAIGTSGRAGAAAAGRLGRYLAQPTDGAAALRSGLITGGSLGALKYLTAPAAADIAPGFFAAMTPAQIAISSGASTLGRYLAPSLRPHASTYLRRRRELQALERLERARAADPREKVKRFLFGEAKEGGYGESALSAPLTKTASSLLEYPGHTKEAFLTELALGTAAATALPRVGGFIRGNLSRIGRSIPKKLFGHTKRKLRDVPTFKDPMQTPGGLEAMQLSPAELGRHIQGVDSNLASSGLGRFLQTPRRIYDRYRADYYANLGRDEQAKIVRDMASGARGARAKARQEALARRGGAAIDQAQRGGSGPTSTIPQFRRQDYTVPASGGGYLSTPVQSGSNNYTIPDAVYREVDDAVATAVNLPGVNSSNIVNSLKPRLKTTYGLENAVRNSPTGATLTSQQVDQAVTDIVEDIIFRRAQAAGYSSADDMLSGFRAYSNRMVPERLQGLGSANPRVKEVLRASAQEGDLVARQQQVAGAGAYNAASKEMNAAFNTGAPMGGLDDVGLANRTNRVNTSSRITQFDEIIESEGFASAADINKAQVAARAAMSSEINAVNRAIGPEINQIINAQERLAGIRETGAAVQDRIIRSGALSSVEEAIANGSLVNEQAFINDLVAQGVDPNHAAEAWRQLGKRITGLVDDAIGKVDEGLQTARTALGQRASAGLGDATNNLAAQVNQQLTAQASVIGRDAAGLAQEGVRLLQKGMPNTAEGQSQAYGLIDELYQGLASRAKPSAQVIEEFNTNVATLRAGGAVSYKPATRDASGVVRRTNPVSVTLDPKAQANMNRMYREGRGATPENIDALRAEVVKNPRTLLNNPDTAAALELQLAQGSAGRELLETNEKVFGKLIGGQTLEQADKAALLMRDPRFLSYMQNNSTQEAYTAVQNLASGGKLTGNAPLKAEVARVLEQYTQTDAYKEIRKLDLGRVIEEGVGRRQAFEAFTAATTPAQESALSRFFMAGLNPQAARGALGTAGATGAAGAAAAAANRQTTASYGRSPLAAPVKTAVALYEEDLDDAGNSPLEPPVFQPPKPRYENKALLSSGALGVETAVKSSSLTLAPTRRAREKHSFLSPPTVYS